MCGRLADGENGDALCDNGLVVNRPGDVVVVLPDGEKVSGKKIRLEAVLVFAVAGLPQASSLPLAVVWWPGSHSRVILPVQMSSVRSTSDVTTDSHDGNSHWHLHCGFLFVA